MNETPHMSFPSSTRLQFRAWTEADRALAYSLWADPDVARYLGGVMSMEAVEARLQLEMDRQRQFGFQYWPIFLRDQGDFVGCAGLRPFHNEPHVHEVGVHIGRRFWSERLGEEAARAVIQHAFDQLGAEALTAGHNPGNVHSKALLERIGFVRTHEEPWGPLEICTRSTA